jgi:hypothetical protein
MSGQPEGSIVSCVKKQSHRAYVLAVCAELTDQRMEVRSVRVSPVTSAVRHADIDLDAPDGGGHVLLRWDELNGWSWQTRDAQPALNYFGAGIRPTPAELVDWMAMSLWQAMAPAAT